MDVVFAMLKCDTVWSGTNSPPFLKYVLPEVLQYKIKPQT